MPSIVAFICLDRRLIIELDGGQHVERQAAAARRTAFLRESGCRVLRFGNDEVLRDTEAVVEVIRETLAAV